MDPASLLIFAIPLLLLVFMFSSQRKRQKQFATVQSSLQPGQEVLTTSGLYATLVSIDDSVAVLETAPGQQVRWDRRAIASVVPAKPELSKPAGPRDEAPTDPSTDQK